MTLRQRRTRRHVPADAINRALLDHMAALEPEPRSIGLQARVEAMRAAHAARLKAERTDLQTLWMNTIQSRSGGLKTNVWTGKQRGQVGHLVKTMPLPDRAMTWPALVEWVAGNWGEACALAIPFKLHARHARYDDDDEWRAKREELLGKPPAIGLFIYYAAEFAHAHAALFHGQGFWEGELRRAARDQRTHELHMARLAKARRVGFANLPPRLRTAAELDDLARRLAERGDDAVADLLAERDKWQALARDLRRDWGRDWRKFLEQAMARERRRQMIADRTPEEQAEVDALWAAYGGNGTEWDGDDTAE